MIYLPQGQNTLAVDRELTWTPEDFEGRSFRINSGDTGIRVEINRFDGDIEDNVVWMRLDLGEGVLHLAAPSKSIAYFLRERQPIQPTEPLRLALEQTCEELFSAFQPSACSLSFSGAPDLDRGAGFFLHVTGENFRTRILLQVEEKDLDWLLELLAMICGMEAGEATSFELKIRVKPIKMSANDLQELATRDVIYLGRGSKPKSYQLVAHDGAFANVKLEEDSCKLTSAFRAVKEESPTAIPEEAPSDDATQDTQEPTKMSGDFVDVDVIVGTFYAEALQIMELTRGSIVSEGIELEAHATVEAAGVAIALGELIELDGHFGVQIIERF